MPPLVTARSADSCHLRAVHGPMGAPIALLDHFDAEGPAETKQVTTDVRKERRLTASQRRWTTQRVTMGALRRTCERPRRKECGEKYIPAVGRQRELEPSSWAD
ncbi:hypothetical protein CERSUDRAFT_86324 [Gelatoporia subvermispora B]|uniref:Uncharacterized protein n=1 Tax=Ceriporiopsis subvermispora (strain B) TaxID=914234 RepID=M2R720_CERS8|nr:hypothetical protein CERSUDRAFT_86324 [Gelatoporia subvermispora B]